MRILNWIDSFMIQHKRKLTLLDYKGDILFHRYCLLYRELGTEETSKHQYYAKWLPNIYIHHFPNAYLSDEETQHTHRGNTLSFILKGGYVERVTKPGQPPYLLKRPRFSFHYMKFPSTHGIVSTVPNTWTVFTKGFTKDKYLVITIVDGTKVKQPTIHYAGKDAIEYSEKKKKSIQRLNRVRTKSDEKDV